MAAILRGDIRWADLNPVIGSEQGGLRPGFRGVFGYMTGVIVHESDLVMTRGSVTLDEAPHIKCHLNDGRRYMAELVRYDRKSKMVLLRLLAGPGEKFPAAKLGESDKVRPGQFVLLVGNAYRVAEGAKPCAVNLGVVSAVTQPSMRAGLADDFDYPGEVILHDAMNNPGVYGGPLVSLAGVRWSASAGRSSRAGGRTSSSTTRFRSTT